MPAEDDRLHLESNAEHQRPKNAVLQLPQPAWWPGTEYSRNAEAAESRRCQVFHCSLLQGGTLSLRRMKWVSSYCKYYRDLFMLWEFTNYPGHMSRSLRNKNVLPNKKFILLLRISVLLLCGSEHCSASMSQILKDSLLTQKCWCCISSCVPIRIVRYISRAIAVLLNPNHCHVHLAFQFISEISFDRNISTKSDVEHTWFRLNVANVSDSPQLELVCTKGIAWKVEWMVVPNCW